MKAVKGTKDLFGNDIVQWHKIEQTMRDVCRRFNVGEIRTPVFEYTQLFEKGTGDTTDIVQKEMYTFLDKKQRSITLRPEGTPGVARAVLEHSLYAGVQPVKLYYIAPMFRYEQPQAGRMRQFHQFGVEYFGAYSPAADAEVISLAISLLDELGLGSSKLEINSLGLASSRASYHEALKKFLNQHTDKLCADCKERLDKNPLRILDCKSERCKEVVHNSPIVVDFLDSDDAAHFEEVQRLLDSMGITYAINPKIVRGLDYYTRTIFEISADGIGAQSTVCGGGRYDNLVEGYGGPPTAGVGFAMGIERLALAMLAGQEPPKEQRVDIYIGAIGEKGAAAAHKLLYKLRRAGYAVEGDTIGRSVKAQLKYADKINAHWSTIMGESEVDSGVVKLKDMDTGEQTEVSIDNIENYIRRDEVL